MQSISGILESLIPILVEKEKYLLTAEAIAAEAEKANKLSDYTKEMMDLFRQMVNLAKKAATYKNSFTRAAFFAKEALNIKKIINQLQETNSISDRWNFSLLIVDKCTANLADFLIVLYDELLKLNSLPPSVASILRTEKVFLEQQKDEAYPFFDAAKPALPTPSAPDLSTAPEVKPAEEKVTEKKEKAGELIRSVSRTNLLRSDLPAIDVTNELTTRANLYQQAAASFRTRHQRVDSSVSVSTLGDEDNFYDAQENLDQLQGSPSPEPVAETKDDTFYDADSGEKFDALRNFFDEVVLRHVQVTSEHLSNIFIEPLISDDRLRVIADKIQILTRLHNNLTINKEDFLTQAWEKFCDLPRVDFVIPFSEKVTKIFKNLIAEQITESLDIYLADLNSKNLCTVASSELLYSIHTHLHPNIVQWPLIGPMQKHIRILQRMMLADRVFYLASDEVNPTRNKLIDEITALQLQLEQNFNVELSEINNEIEAKSQLLENLSQDLMHLQNNHKLSVEEKAAPIDNIMTRRSDIQLKVDKLRACVALAKPEIASVLQAVQYLLAELDKIYSVRRRLEGNPPTAVSKDFSVFLNEWIKKLRLPEKSVHDEAAQKLLELIAIDQPNRLPINKVEINKIVYKLHQTYSWLRDPDNVENVEDEKEVEVAASLPPLHPETSIRRPIGASFTFRPASS